ncbi:serine/threonine-protein kinase [Pseudobacillus wudalianchiensis]|uniref:serine/threonine-protein kinase n=1 Tax=Pseudobacillus wudalianchiensis TaxID=1743143 RepID=UPI0008087050|nr:serine/threonine-protein kinase [Bacillus wudalianchiensis]
MNEFHWKEIVLLIEAIEVRAGEGNVPVEIGSVPEELQCVGIGTDAAVFVHSFSPSYAFKVYAEGKEQKKVNEVRAYEKLADSSYFPVFYGAGSKFIVISFESGMNLYDCLVTGTYISPEVIEQVDKAIEEARVAGLNPRDIHLKNIILQEDSIKLIDVSEYVKPGNDQRWEHLKEAYRLYYPLIASKPVSPKFLDFVKEQYNKYKHHNFSLGRFGRLFTALLEKEKK